MLKDAPVRSDIEAQLGRILLDPEFQRNRGASNFLKFVVDETLEGRGPRLKAFTIALAVFGRDANFDPQNNSIVRVQAARLRQLLQTYYEGSGAGDPLRIQMPLGKYQVQFDEAETPPAPVEPEIDPDPEPEPPAIAAEPPKRAWPKQKMLLFASLAAAIAILGLILLLHPAKTASPVALQAELAMATPILTIAKAETPQTPDKGSAFTAEILDAIESKLVAFDTVTVRQPAVAGGQASLVSYVLLLKSAAPQDGVLRLGFRLIHAPTGELVWSRDFSDVAMTDSALHAVSDSVVRQVADVYGAIAIDTLNRTKPWPEKPRGYLCQLSAFDYMKDRTEAKRQRTRECLEAEIAADPANAKALALLAGFLVRDYLDAVPGGHGAEDLGRATGLAQRAFDHDSQRARPNFMLFLTGFYDNRFDEAFAAAQKALKLNADAGIMSAQVGAGYISRGEYRKGDALLVEAQRNGWAPPGFVTGFSALSVYMQGDETGLRQFARRASAADGSIGLLLKMVASHKFNDPDGAARAYDLLKQAYPGVAADISGALNRYAFTDEIKQKLLSDLRSAGYGLSQ